MKIHNSKYTLEQIREFWTEQAKVHKKSPAASWSDKPVIEMEIQEILSRINDGDKVIDVGCANGYSSIAIASQRKVQLKGVDYIPEMIAEANERIKEIGNSLKGIAEFQVGDITNLKEKKEAFDKVVVIRVLINLRDWDRQVLGLKQCTKLLKPGGKLLLSEATLQGWQKLNRFRLEWGLKEIPIPAFNHYLDQDKIVEAALPELELVEIVNFASSYFVATRVFKPLLAKAIASEIDISNPLMEFNRFFSYFPQVGDYGTQKLFVFKKNK